MLHIKMYPLRQPALWPRHAAFILRGTHQSLPHQSLLKSGALALLASPGPQTVPFLSCPRRGEDSLGVPGSSLFSLVAWALSTSCLGCQSPGPPWRHCVVVFYSQGLLRTSPSVLPIDPVGPALTSLTLHAFLYPTFFFVPHIFI